MVSKEQLIKKYEGKEYLAIAAVLKIALYEINFDESYVFGATESQNSSKIYFLRHIEVDENGYLYFSLHNMRHYRKEFKFLRTPPQPPNGYIGEEKE